MGGDRISSTTLSTASKEELSMAEEDFVEQESKPTSILRDSLSMKDVDDQVSAASLDLSVPLRRKKNIYKAVYQSYESLQTRSEHLEEAKRKILSYTPGAWIEGAGGTKLSNYDVPNIKSLLLIGPKGSGKSSLINRISKVFEDDKFAPTRAQVSYNSSQDGTLFLHEYMIPKGAAASLCLYDTRSLSDNLCDNIKMLGSWMTDGVRHGEMIIMDSDTESLRAKMMRKARPSDPLISEIREANFVIYVVNGLSILKSMGNGNETKYTQMIADTFNSPYLSFKDDKPVIVVTHGDLLTIHERARARVHLGELLSVHPATQIFDIPESCDSSTDLVIVDMLRYALEHSDQNLRPRVKSSFSKVWALFMIPLAVFIMVGYYLLVTHVMQHFHDEHSSEPTREWSTMRHLWYDLD